MERFEEAVELKTTLGLVASKSGSTLEPNVFLAYFFDRLKAVVGPERAGHHVMAITDPGDEVILAAYDYPGNFLSVHAVGARPVLVDVAPGDWNLCPEKVAEAVRPQTRAVIASHLHGGLVPMARLMELAAGHGLAVIEDAAQCPGALVQGRKAGTWGDVGVLSFGGSKLLSAGRGGARRQDCQGVNSGLHSEISS